LGGAYDYWPDGLDANMQQVAAPFDNVALVADNDRIYHRIGSIGDPSRAPEGLTSNAEILATNDAWHIHDGASSPPTHTVDEIRISILWKARVTAPDAPANGHDALDARTIVAVFDEDLRQRGVDIGRPSDPASDERWIQRLHAIYYSPAAPA